MFYNHLLCLLSVVVSKHIKNTWTYYTNLFSNTRFNFILINSNFRKVGYPQCKPVLWMVYFLTLACDNVNSAVSNPKSSNTLLSRWTFYWGPTRYLCPIYKYLWKSNQRLVICIANNISFDINYVQPKNGNIPKTRSRCS